MARKLALVAAVFALSAGAVHAQGRDVEWRVVNDLSPTEVPQYQQQPNPFPTREAPPPVVEEEPEDAEQILMRERAELLAAARRLISSARVYQPDASQITFDGYMKGPEGEKLLFRGHWIPLGGKAAVPSKGADAAYRTLRQLEELDSSLAEQVRAELDARLSNSPQIELTVKAIEDEYVILQNNSGETLRVPLSQSRF